MLPDFGSLFLFANAKYLQIPICGFKPQITKCDKMSPPSVVELENLGLSDSFGGFQSRTFCHTANKKEFDISKQFQAKTWDLGMALNIALSCYKSYLSTMKLYKSISFSYESYLYKILGIALNVVSRVWFNLFNF